MDYNVFLTDSTAKDPTWSEAYRIVKTGLMVPSHVFRLFKEGWNGAIEPKQYLKVMGFSRLNPACLLDAAEFDTENEPVEGNSISHAITYLGIPFSAVVLAVNLTSRIILKSKPRTGWKRLLQDMITNIEIGYKFGLHVSEVRVEGGALIGFSKYAALGLLMATKPQAYKKYQDLCRAQEHVSHDEITEIFGCALYQVTAFTLQQLGFGTEIAFGVALGDGRIDAEHLTLDRDVLRWKAAYQWIEALRRGRNFPADIAMRNFFPEVAPASTLNGERNITLEVLHTEISKLRSAGSLWTWHLPRPGYEITQDDLGLR